MKKFYFLSIFLIQFLSHAQSLDSIQKLEEVVLTGTKYPLMQKYSGKIIAKITKEELAQNPSKTVAQLLDTQLGFELNGVKSPFGKNIGMYAQGGKTGQVLIILDGIPQIDPSGIDMSYDLNMLSASQIESVEIMQGAAGTLYGSGAATAVINIKTLDNSAQKISVEAGSTLSTHRKQNDAMFDGNSWSQRANISGKINKISYLLAYNGMNANGLSEAQAIETDFKDNPFSKHQLLTKVGIDLSKDIFIGLLGSWGNSFHQFDQDAFTDSEVNKSNNKEYRFALQSHWKYKYGRLQWVSEVKNTQRDYQQFNDWTSVVDAYVYRTKSWQSDMFNLIKLSDKIDILTGLNLQYHQTDNETPYGNIDSKNGQYNSIDPYVNVVLKDFAGFNLSLGSRLNIHSNYGNHSTFSVNPSYVIPISSERFLKLLGSWSSAYLVPSIFQLHSFYGNTNLQPETTETLEFGLEYHNQTKITFHALYFERSEKQSIIFVTDPNTWVSHYENDFNDIVYVSGFESGINFRINKDLKLKSNYTFTKLSKTRPYSIPKHKWNTQITYQPLKKSTILVSYQYASDRKQLDFTDFPYQAKVLNNYHLFNVGFSQNLMEDQLNVNLSIDNLSDTQFVETIGYNTLGRNFALSFLYKIK